MGISAMPDSGWREIAHSLAVREEVRVNISRFVKTVGSLQIQVAVLQSEQEILKKLLSGESVATCDNKIPWDNTSADHHLGDPAPAPAPAPGPEISKKESQASCPTPLPQPHGWTKVIVRGRRKTSH